MKFSELLKLKDILCLIDVREFGQHSVEFTVEFREHYQQSNGEVKKIFFDYYISFEVLNEGFDFEDNDEVYEGHFFRIYSKSKYLDYIKSATIFEDVHPDTPLIHYQIVCQDHIINVVSADEPEILLIRREDSE